MGLAGIESGCRVEPLAGSGTCRVLERGREAECFSTLIDAFGCLAEVLNEVLQEYPCLFLWEAQAI